MNIMEIVLVLLKGPPIIKYPVAAVHWDDSMLGDRLIYQSLTRKMVLDSNLRYQLYVILYDSLFKFLLSYIHIFVGGFQHKTGLSNSTQALVTTQFYFRIPILGQESRNYYKSEGSMCSVHHGKILRIQKHSINIYQINSWFAPLFAFHPEIKSEISPSEVNIKKKRVCTVSRHTLVTLSETEITNYK